MFWFPVWIHHLSSRRLLAGVISGSKRLENFHVWLKRSFATNCQYKLYHACKCSYAYIYIYRRLSIEKSIVIRKLPLIDKCRIISMQMLILWYSTINSNLVHDLPWISPWKKSISNELNITIHVIASQLSHNCHVISNRLWRHQQNEDRASETRGRCVVIVVFIVIHWFVMSCKK